jgi:DNA polymerase III delta prime subunit
MEVPMTTLWIDKYEPKTLDEMVLNRRTRSKLVKVMRDCPHVILYGGVGIGKTTFTKIFFKKFRHVYISGKKGVAVIRDEVKAFAVGDYLGTFFADPEDMDIRYVIINEADWLSDDSQAELRMIIEDNQQKTRFAFITNEKDKLQDQIRSRCREVEFEKADHREVVEFIKRILHGEGVTDNHVGNLVNQVWQHHPGDIRRIIEFAQSQVVDGKLDLI